MKNIYIHIGLSKTGTSAIQTWLLKNAKKLRRLNYFYSDLALKGKKGKITSGNGTILYKACKTESSDTVRNLLINGYTKQGKHSIVSSEFFQNLPREGLIKLKAGINEIGFKPKIICYARSAYELIYSNYIQGIKRHGQTKGIDEFRSGDYSQHVKFLRNYQDVFGDCFEVFNYDTDKKILIKSFANNIGIEDDSFTRETSDIVNRSLDFSEAEVLRQMNDLHKGEFSTELSDYFINRNPSKKTSVYYSAKLVDRVSREASRNINWVNDSFMGSLGKPLEVINPDFELTPAQEPLTLNDFLPVYEWCMNYKYSNSTKSASFLDFVFKFCSHLQQYDKTLASKLFNKYASKFGRVGSESSFFRLDRQ